MGRPQQPELARSSKTDIDPDHVETGLQGQKGISTGGETGPIPPDNQPGHHPPKEQDKPDLDAFAAKLGTDPDAPTATAARKGRKPAANKATPAKTTPAKTTPSSKTASRPAPTEKESPAAPPKVQVTPAKRPAAVPGPSKEEAAHFTAPQPEPEKEPGRQSSPEAQEQPQEQEQEQRESFLTSLMLLPLRETVKQLERLNEHLTERLEGNRRR